MPLNPPLDNWKDKIVWVVGASSGIGRATASALHAAGAKVVVSARNQQALDLFVLEHPTSWAIAVDITKAADVQQAAHRIVATHGRLDMVLVCAGHYAPQSALQFDLQEMLRHRAINYDGVLHCIAATLPQLLVQQQGHISFISSVAGYRGLPKALAYGPTKAALQNLADVLYLDLHGQGLGVSVVNPGFVATPLTAHNDFAMPALLTPEQAAAHMLDGWAKGQFEIHFPKRFTLWLKLLRVLPDRLYFWLVGRLVH